MSRLLFAAARGARIQSEYHNWSIGGHEWRSADMNNLYASRIHPDDEHLQYGPISTALQGMSLTPKSQQHVMPELPAYLGISVQHSTREEFDAVLAYSELDHALFLLILAEALADEGL